MPPPPAPRSPRLSSLLEEGRDRRWLRILLWTVAGVVALAVAGGAAGLLWLRQAALAALPALDGTAHLAGLSAAVAVRRDAHGVPHIEAANQDDLFVAQGYVTAQDRLWQMDLYRRNADGTLAAILGPSLLKHDEEQRVLQLRSTAERIYKAMAPDERRRFEDYARGVNLYIAQCEQTGRLPPEFKLLFYRPAPWTGVDSLAVGMTLVETLDTHVETKLTRAVVDAKLHDDPKLEADLYPIGSWRDHPPTGQILDLSKPQPAPPLDSTLNDGGEAARAAGMGMVLPAFTPPSQTVPWFLRGVLGLPTCRGCIAGSNNWVVAGAHTASGKPLLANDMHLELTAPNIWYMADLSAPGFHAAGVTLPGVPYIIAGHNEHVAWGFTALGGDVQDLYIEKLDGKGDYYQAATATTPGAWKPLRDDRETFDVRGGRSVRLDIQFTDHGPLLNPLLPRSEPPVALKWTLYDATLNTIPLYEMDTASNWTEFEAALAAWCWPTQNLVYADDQGHIAYQAIGRIPIRSAGLTEEPIVNDGDEWEGYIPFQDMPSAVDPPSGFLATANSRVTTLAAPYPITLEWGEPYRAERIYHLLEGRNNLTPADMLDVQTDIYSAVDRELGQRFAYAIDQTASAGPRLRQAADLMRSWDGRVSMDSSAASIVDWAREAFWPLILDPKIGKDGAHDYHWTEGAYAEEQIIMNGGKAWLPPGYKDWNALLTAAVAEGLKEGDAPRQLSKWTYGSWHVIQIEHPLVQFLPFLSRIAGVGPLPLSGDRTTIKQVGRSFGPSERFTMDWSNIDGSTENIVLGESGNPLSPYFRDQWDDWYTGKTFRLPFSEAAVAAQTRHTLRLMP